MRHCVSGTAMGSSVRRWIKAFGLAAAALAKQSKKTKKNKKQKQR